MEDVFQAELPFKLTGKQGHISLAGILICNPTCLSDPHYSLGLQYQ